MKQGKCFVLKKKYLTLALRLATLLLCAIILAACEKSGPTGPTNQPLSEPGSVIPQPESVQQQSGTFVLTENTSIYVNSGSIEITAIGQYLADRLRPSTGFQLNVVPVSGSPESGHVYLTTVGGDPSLGEEGYTLTVTNNSVMLVAYQPAGLFRGIQTIRQLLPPSIESSTKQSGPWEIGAVTISDHPRFAWRGMMLDVARHFFSVQDVKRTIDLIAYYKINRLHLHLSDDQGWRIMINSWPNLAIIGGSTGVGGGPGGYYTQEEYSDIVAYAQSRYIMIVPEIDMPSHINSALASYGVLNRSGNPTRLYTGFGVGIGTLALSLDTTYAFVRDVIRELAAITPGPYIHIGGDEAPIPTADYTRFIEWVQGVIQSNGKQMIGWEEIAREIFPLPQSHNTGRVPSLKMP